MKYSLLVPGVAVMIIIPAQYTRLRESGSTARGNQYEKTILADYATYQAEHTEARAYWHEQHHKTTDAPCYYDGCKRRAA